MKLLYLFLVLGIAMVRAEEVNEAAEPEKMTTEEVAPAAEEKKKPSTDDIVSSDDSKTTALVENDQEQVYKRRGFCHWAVNIWYRPGQAIRCGCMRCVCSRSRWNCVYYFPYCVYYYCGGRIYNPRTQVCCCGKIYTKRSAFNCCGYFYYNVRTAKCCNYYTVKPKRANCPRYTIRG